MKAVTSQNFTKEVLESKKTVLLDVWAPWCPPCRGMEPILEQVNDEVKDWGEVVKFNTEEDQALAQQLNITALPTFLIFKDGKLKNSTIGATSKSRLVELMS